MRTDQSLRRGNLNQRRFVILDCFVQAFSYYIRQTATVVLINSLHDFACSVFNN